jgi:hypothetical protein
MRAIQTNAAVIVVAAAEDAVVVARKVKALKEPMQIHKKIQQRNQRMVLRASPLMARHTVAAAAAVQQEKMSLQEKPLMKMASSLSSRFVKCANAQLVQSVQNAELAIANVVVTEVVIATAVIHVEIIVSHIAAAEQSLQMVNS